MEEEEILNNFNKSSKSPNNQLSTFFSIKRIITYSQLGANSEKIIINNIVDKYLFYFPHS